MKIVVSHLKLGSGIAFLCFLCIVLTPVAFAEPAKEGAQKPSDTFGFDQPLEVPCFYLTDWEKKRKNGILYLQGVALPSIRPIWNGRGTAEWNAATRAKEEAQIKQDEAEKECKEAADALSTATKHLREITKARDSAKSEYTDKFGLSGKATNDAAPGKEATKLAMNKAEVSRNFRMTLESKIEEATAELKDAEANAKKASEAKEAAESKMNEPGDKTAEMATALAKNLEQAKSYETKAISRVSKCKAALDDAQFQRSKAVELEEEDRKEAVRKKIAASALNKDEDIAKVATEVAKQKLDVLEDDYKSALSNQATATARSKAADANCTMTREALAEAKRNEKTAEESKKLNDIFTFYIDRDPADKESRDAWNRILASSGSGGTRTMSVAVGIQGDLPEQVKYDNLRNYKMQIYTSGTTVLFVLFISLVGGGGVYLAKNTDMLRDRGEVSVAENQLPAQALLPTVTDADRQLARADDASPTTSGPPPKAAFSLAKAQMAFWSFLVLAAFVFVWLVTGKAEPPSTQVLALMGISAATGLSALAINDSKRNKAKSDLEKLRKDQASLTKRIKDLGVAEDQAKLDDVTKKIEELAPEAEASASTGYFFSDILRDSTGVSFHRVQVVIWTIVLGITFLTGVFSQFSMPAFPETLLVLMGISNGTYLGFKIPEK